MRALFFTPAFPPFIGGGERYARSLALALAERGPQITVITSQAQREDQFWTGAGKGIVVEHDGPLTVVRCALRAMPGGWHGLLAWRKAMTILSMLPGDQTRLLNAMARRVPGLENVDRVLASLPETPDLIHGFNLSWEHAALAAAEYAGRRSLPFVLTPFMHFGNVAPGENHTSGRLISRRMARNTTMDHQRRLLAEARTVLSLTRIECEELARRQIDTRDVVVVGGGVDAPPPISDVAPLVARHNLSGPFALFIGRVNRDKGAIDAARATLRLVQAGKPLTLALVGRVAQDFQRFYAGLNDGQRSHLRLLDHVDEETKHALLQQATMLVLPSQAESFGIVLLEAWLHATPVVAARSGGIPGVVDDGDNGLLTPYGDVEALTEAMERLLHDETLRRTLGRQGQEKVREKYTWDAVAGRTLTVYQRVTR